MRLIAAPRSNDHTVGGWYTITGCSPLLFDDCGGLDDGGDNDEYGSESDGMVSEDADRSREGEGERSERDAAMMWDLGMCSG
jgi:hypothetical protein